MLFKLAVFGSPIEHSLSPLIHQHFAYQFKHNIDYQKILVHDNFATLVQNFLAQEHALGCNITVPCKFAAYKICQHLSTRAHFAQAVNTIVKTQEGLYGDNTDGMGLYLDLQRLNCPLDNAKILILGAGGASYGIIEPLLTKAHSISVVNRSFDKAQALAKLHPKIKAYTYDKLNGDFDLIINATSLSLAQQLPPLEDKIYSSAYMVYDLFYTRIGGTIFTHKAQSLKVKYAYDGLGMLVSQAALAYEQWFKCKPNIALTLEYMKEKLNAAVH